MRSAKIWHPELTDVVETEEAEAEATDISKKGCKKERLVRKKERYGFRRKMAGGHITTYRKTWFQFFHETRVIPVLRRV